MWLEEKRCTFILTRLTWLRTESNSNIFANGFTIFRLHKRQTFLDQLKKYQALKKGNVAQGSLQSDFTTIPLCIHSTC